MKAVEVEIWPSSGRMLMMAYRVQYAENLALPQRSDGPIDGLWQHTCFELFAKSNDGTAYREFNFAPSSGWAVYDFIDTRRGMTAFDPPTAPHLVDCRIDDRRDIYPEIYELDVVLGWDTLPRNPMIGLSAVIEETDGTKSYWALAHPPGAPDFHHPACFALELPAIPAG